MTQDEELISNISYTNSDFRTIFPQLLDTAKKLSNKWDPSLSNESDPGNILLKEAAIVGDKNNYHIDKNVLECFPLSATQQSSARQLYDLVGYTMHWYKSAYTNVQFTLLKSISNIISENADLDLNFDSIKLNAGTQVCDSTGEYVYTLLQPTSLQNLKEVVSVSAIQGVIQPYEINGNNTITIDNLDENLRIYFPQNFIAENGIFVYDAGADVGVIGYNNDINTESGVQYWGLVDNITKYKANSRIFKFGLDLDSDKCYIEFPQDIMKTIGNGLNIYYTISKGNDGNIKAGVLNSFVNDILAGDRDDTSDTITINPYIKISNTSSAQGTDPESLQDAYKNYKRTIGTYDTLVSRRDYNNAIYNLKQFKNKNLSLISNGYVSDRCSDINCSQSVIVNNGDRDFSKNYVKENSSNNSTLNSYDIILYLLKQPNSLTSIDDYNATFEPDLDQNTKLSIEQDLEDFKSVQHDINYISDSKFDLSNPYFDITNVIEVQGTLTTYYKVTKAEAKQIETNVINALIQAYNSRQLIFGEQIYYDDIVNTIKNADDRIRNINLNVPNYEPFIQYANNSAPQSLYKSTTINPLSNIAINNETIAKMILAGKVQLFNFLDDFQVDFGQTGAIEYSNIEQIKTENDIEINAATWHELEKNDIIQIVTPNFQVKATYSATVRYAFKSTAISSILSNTIYVLTDNDTLKVIYSNDSGTLESHVLPTGTIIRPQGFDLVSDSDRGWSNEFDYKSILSAGQSIEELVLSNSTINANSTYYYIVTNNITQNNNKKYYTLQLVANQEYILQENEYFIYTSNDTNGFIILSSGTGLKCANNLTLQSEILDLDKVYDTSYEDIYNNSTVWNLLESDIIKVENEIVTLTEGDSIWFNSGIELSNDLQQVFVEVDYKYSNEDKINVITSIENLNDYIIQARSSMILSANSVNSQLLNGNQKLYVDNGSGFNLIAETGQSILFNYPINLVGGNNINVQVLNESTGAYESLVSCLVFIEGNYTTLTTDIKRDNNVFTINSTTTFNFTFNKTSNITNPINTTDVAYYIIPISGSIIGDSTTSASLSISITNGSVQSFYRLLGTESDNRYGESTNSTYVFNDILVITCDNNTGATDLTFTFNNCKSGSKVEVGYISRIHSINSEEINTEKVANKIYYKYDILSDNNYTDILSKLKDLPGAKYFDWTYRVPSINKVLEPLAGESYFNSNHVYNQYTIPKINIAKSEIKVSPSNII